MRVLITSPVFPPDLGVRLTTRLHNGFPASPINISALG